MIFDKYKKLLKIDERLSDLEDSLLDLKLLLMEPEDKMENLTQVIERLPDGKVRVYNIVSLFEATQGDPLTTIEVEGYEDVEAKPVGSALV